MKRNWLQMAITIFILFGTTTALYLYTAGYRINRQPEVVEIRQTGMVGAKSIPESASVYLNGVLVTATDNTIPGITPGNHTLRITKPGFVEWVKEIEVFEELVTDITAVLVSRTPRLEPLTNTGAKSPTISPTQTSLAYFSQDDEDPGVWIIPLAGEGLNLFRSNPYVVLADTIFREYSNGKTIEWSPDEDELLIALEDETTEEEDEIYFLVDLDTNTASSVSDPTEIRIVWSQESLEKREDFITNLEIPQDLENIALDPETVWAPDQKKFLYTVNTRTQIEYRVYNLEKPLPVGEQVENIVFTIDINTPQPAVSWYADSFHLIMTELDEENFNRGTISLIRIDGTNKTEVYNNTLLSENVYTTPGGDKLVILTSFTSGNQTDLYTVGIR